MLFLVCFGVFYRFFILVSYRKKAERLLFSWGFYKALRNIYLSGPRWMTSSAVFFIEQCYYGIETRQLICYANQLTGFYTIKTLVIYEVAGALFKGVNRSWICFEKSPLHKLFGFNMYVIFIS